MKKIFIIMFTLMLFTTLPVSAVRWVDAGEDTGMKTGIYMDFDAISDTGNEISLVYKFTNDKLLELFSLFDQKQPKLSVCLMQSSFNCTTGKPTSFAMLCYDKSGGVAIDEVGSEADFNKYNQYNSYSRYQNNKINCQEFRNMKKLMYK